MAYTPRTLNEIYLAIVTEKQTFSSLSGLTTDITSQQELLTELNSNSKVSIYNLWMYITAVSIWTLEKIMGLFITEVDEIVSSAIIGTSAWYVQKVKQFQYNSGTLIINPTTYAVEYDIEDTTAQIIEHAATIESGGNLILKVRRLASDILSTPELNAFKSYINKVKFAGTRIIVWNYDADLLKLYFEIKYDPIIPLSTITTNVETVINDYLDNIEFNSTVNINSLIDNLQAIEGVLDPQFNEGYGKFDIAAYVAFSHTYDSTAGWCKIDPLYPLSSTITYTAVI